MHIFRKLMLIYIIIFICPFVHGYDGNYCLEFDGNDDYVEIGNVLPDIFKSSSAGVTICVWVKVADYTPTGDKGMIIQKWHTAAASDNDFILYADGDVRTQGNKAGNPAINADHEWHHYSFTMDNAGLINVYLDGEFVESTSEHSFNGTVYTLRIGALHDSKYDFKGNIDEVQIWNRPLLPVEIAWYMRHKCDGDEEGLVGYWDFDTIEDNVVYDLTGTDLIPGNHGTIYGNPSIVESPIALVIERIPAPYLNFAKDWSCTDVNLYGLTAWDAGDYAGTERTSDAPFLGKYSGKFSTVEANRYIETKIVPGENGYDILLGTQGTFAVWIKPDVVPCNVTLSNIGGQSSEYSLESTDWQRLSLDCDAICKSTDDALIFRMSSDIMNTYDFDCVTIAPQDEPAFQRAYSFPNHNFCTNWSMEDESIETPHLVSGSYYLDDTDAKYGRKCLNMSLAAYSYIISDKLKAYRALTGKKLCFSVWLKSDQPENCSVEIGYNGNNQARSITADWVQYHIMFPKAENTGQTIEFDLFNYGSGNLLCDGFLIEPVDEEVPNIPSKPIITTQYSDQQGNPVQTQISHNGVTRIQASIYNNKNQTVVSSKWISVNTETHSYFYDVLGAAAAYYKNYFHLNENYPYSTNVIEDGLRSRLSHQYKAGIEMSDKPITYKYCVFNGLDGDGKMYKEVILTNEDGIDTRNVYNNKGKMVENVIDAAVGGIGAKTRFAYDEFGNMKEIKPPKYFDNSNTENVKLKKEYRYNNAGELLASEYPDMIDTDDGDEDDIELFPDERYRYNSSGQLKFRQDAEMKARWESDSETHFVQTDYDIMGRIHEISTVVSTVAWDALDPDAATVTGTRTVHSWYVYDKAPVWSDAPWNTITVEKRQMIGDLRYATAKIAAVAYRCDISNGTKFGFTFYSYTDDGKLERLVQLFPDDAINPISIHYEYFLNGSLRCINTNNTYKTYYTYNEFNKLSAVGTSDGGNEICMYTYDNLGNVDEVIYYRNNGTQVMNRLKYRYTINDQLSAINDPDEVGVQPGINFAEVINYTSSEFSCDGVNGAGYHNGAIANTEFALKLPADASGAVDRFGYKYAIDGMNRITAADYFTILSSGSVGSQAYDVNSVTYDANGNLDYLLRRGEDGSTLNELDYEYADGTNRLLNTTGIPANTDMRYSRNGELKAYVSKDIGSATEDGFEYGYHGLPVRINTYNGTGVVPEAEFAYDAMGRRIYSSRISPQ